jgi:hypothetical protein
MKLKVRKTFTKKVYRTTHQADAEGAVEEDEYEDPEEEDEVFKQLKATAK